MLTTPTFVVDDVALMQAARKRPALELRLKKGARWNVQAQG